jgi:hypothetical protein
MPRRRHSVQHGLFRIWGLEINLNTVITTVLGSLACSGIALCFYYIHTGFVLFSKMEADVPKLERELHRLSVQYPPLIAPNFNASVNTPAAATTPTKP